MIMMKATCTKTIDATTLHSVLYYIKRLNSSVNGVSEKCFVLNKRSSITSRPTLNSGSVFPCNFSVMWMKDIRVIDISTSESRNCL